MSDQDTLINNKLLSFIRDSQDGYCLLGCDDRVLFCNQVYAGIFANPVDEMIGMSFDELVTSCFERRRGIFIEGDDLEGWLMQAHQQRRKHSSRMFSIDLVDGRWFLLTESLSEQGDLFIHAKDITAQKRLEMRLIDAQRRLRQMALTDDLTRIINRRCFITRVTAEIGRCEQQQQPYALIILDLDKFKNINDQNGHLVGDRVLQRFAEAISLGLREEDVFGRIGGDEFAVFMANVSCEEALKLARRLCRRAAGVKMIGKTGAVPVSISAGVACSESVEADFEKLYEVADRAMYQAKARGGGQAAVAEV